MSQTITQLIINSPYEEPRHYWGYENFGDVRSQSALRRDGSKAGFFARDIELLL